MHVLIFTGGNAPFPQDTRFYFSHAPKVDYVIAADSGLDTLEAFRLFYKDSYDFSPDFIVGDMDSLRDSSLLQKYSSVRTELYKRDQDFTDTELALQHAHSLLKEPGQNMITLLGGDGGQMEHTLAIYDSFSTEYHADVWLTTKRVVCYVQDGHTLKFNGLNTDHKISVMRTSKSYSGGKVITSGLAWEGTVFRKEGMPSISNRIKHVNFATQEPVSISAEGDNFLVLLPLDATVWYPEPTESKARKK